jgi:hypothetical protein
MMNDEEKTGSAEARKRRSAEKTICANQCNQWTKKIRVNSCNSWAGVFIYNEIPASLSPDFFHRQGVGS